jgi:pyruvate,water dikinase
MAFRCAFQVPSFTVLDPEEARTPERALERIRTALGSRGRVAVRSSAVEEDGARRSYAGQFETVLGVDLADDRALIAAIARVVASASSDHARAYAGAQPVRMAVVVQELVEAAVSGVAFSVDPVAPSSGRAVVSAVYGLGEGLVQGTLDADTWRIGPNGTERSLAHKTLRLEADGAGGTRTVPVPPESVDAPCLSDEEALGIADLTRRIAQERGGPQDVEWALGPRGIPTYVLQARPITTLPGERIVWDNSNIVESYSGVTTPLTFTFARHVYEVVYRQFVEVLGVPDQMIRAHEPTFAAMLGLVRGRVYYNLVSWYRVIAMLPGLEFNRGFMERMMGVREALTAPPPPATLGNRAADALRVARTIVRILAAERGLGKAVPAFHARVDEALASVPRGSMSRTEAVDHYRRLERDLLHEWRTPIVNDFFAMIAFGTLSRLAERWLPDAPATIVNDLLCGEGGIVSTEPARALMAIARRADRKAFAEEPDDRVLWTLLAGPLREELEAYRTRFGDRGMEELKLETVTPAEDPALLVGMVRAYLAAGSVDPDASQAQEQAIREAAEARVRTGLGGLKRATFFFVLRKARARVRDRENLRFERTRVFAVVRRIALALGGDLARTGVLASPRDVFFLELDEMLGEPSPDLAARVAGRKARFAEFARTPAPPDRFETYGPPDDDQVGARTPVVHPGDLKGTGCCPGVVRAPVRVVRDPREAGDLAGRILVTERTDPGWTLLFPIAAGLLVERGSLLSHAAIVAREVGLPCVVGIEGLLDTLKDGELVEMDGTSGVVRRPGAA